MLTGAPVKAMFPNYTLAENIQLSQVREFGAVGDGKADDTGAVQHAVERGDGRIVFPPGTYRLTRPVVIDLARYGPASVEGSGGAARLLMDGPGPALRFVGSHDKNAGPDSFRPDVWRRERFPTVRGIEIEGRHDDSRGVELTRTMMATLTGVSIRRCRYGVHLVERNRNVLIADSHVYHGRPGGIGIYFDGVNLHQTNIVGCHISYCPHAGIKVARSEIRNLQITGCDIEYNFDPDAPDSADVWIDARESTVREGTISSCTIQAKRSPGGANVRIEGPTLDDSRGAGLWTITGNVLQSQEVNLLLRSVRGVNATGNSFASGYVRSVVLDRCRHVVLGSSTLDHNPDYGGDRVDGVTVRDSSGVTLTGLIVEGARSGTEGTGGAIEIFDSADITLSACQVFEPLHRGIELSGVTRCRVADCTVVDRRPEPTLREAIRVGGESRHNLLTNNIVGRGTVAAVAADDGAASASGNLVVG